MNNPPQIVHVGPEDVSEYMREFAGAGPALPANAQTSITARQQAQFNARNIIADESGTFSPSMAESARNLYQQQNSLFRPTARPGNVLSHLESGSADFAAAAPTANQMLALVDASAPYSHVMCAIQKEAHVRNQVQQRLDEANAKGFAGNPALERARALRTGNIVPRKVAQPQPTGQLLGNNSASAAPSGGASSAR